MITEKEMNNLNISSIDNVVKDLQLKSPLDNKDNFDIKTQPCLKHPTVNIKYKQYYKDFLKNSPIEIEDEPKYRETIEQCAMCKAEQSALKLKQDENKRTKLASQRLNILLGHAQIPQRYKNLTFQNYEMYCEMAQSQIVYILQEAIREFPKTKRIITLLGKPGTGKTMLAYIMLQELIKKYNITAYSIKVTDLLSKLKSFFNNDKIHEPEVMQKLNNIDVLFLDEIGVHDSSAEGIIGWTHSKLYSLIDYRYSWQKTLILTSNFRKDELEYKLGERIYERLMEPPNIIYQCDWNSYREILYEKEKKKDLIG